VSTGRLHVCQRDGNTVEWRPFFAGWTFARAGEDRGIVDGLLLIAGRFSESVSASWYLVARALLQARGYCSQTSSLNFIKASPCCD
jgi:hypothetical protein